MWVLFWQVYLLFLENIANFNLGYEAFLFKMYGDNILFENGVEAEKLRVCLQPLFQSVLLYEDIVKG